YKLGAVAVPLAMLFGVDALEYRLNNCGAKALVTTQQGRAKIAPIRHRVPRLDTVIDVDDGFYRQLAATSPDLSIVDTTPDDPALMIYTSGTTGPPKGALHGHRVLLGPLPCTEFTHEGLPLPDDLLWTPADWAWAGGLLDVLLPGLY